MQRVAMVVLSRYPRDPRVRREAEALERHGFAVDVFCIRNEDEKPVEQFGKVTAYRITEAREKENILPYLWFSLVFLYQSFRALQRQSKQTPYQLIQFHNMPDYLVLAGLWHKMRGVPLLLDLHDLMVELYRSRWGKRSVAILLPFVQLIEGISQRLANRLITTSYGFQNCLLKRGIPQEKITLVLNSADHHIFQYRPREYNRYDRKVRLLYHGTVAERFGIHTALEAFALIHKQLPESTFQIYGLSYMSDYIEQLHAIIEREGLKDHVFLNNCQPLETIARVIGDADIGIVPYLSDPFMDIALSTKSFEYVSMGLPVVASKLPSITSIFGEECVAYYEAGDPQGMADQVLALCADPERQRVQAENALKTYEGVAWPIMEKRYVDLVTDLIAGSKGRRG
ncbi:MAG TPA: glycosyltransferase family 4 protein [Candidatus Sumerlaeota bacterium]|nr:glycosyltransferase family 4 protein [Candidatus Sumerlaeota bacterium]HPS02516.1 glycosyltransferase family 4 protein [Candidatus Sumerlaeota bacterium]